MRPLIETEWNRAPAGVSKTVDEVCDTTVNVTLKTPSRLPTPFQGTDQRAQTERHCRRSVASPESDKDTIKTLLADGQEASPSTCC